MVTHTKDKPFKCNICDKRFNHRSNLFSHKRIHTGDRPFSCEICGKSFVHKNNYTTHILRHSTDKPHKCYICGKGFILKSILNQHMKIHKVQVNGIVNIKTEPDESVSLINQFVQNAISQHSAEPVFEHLDPSEVKQLFECSVCEEEFKDKMWLEIHLKTHTENPFKCKSCHLEFNDIFALQDHFDGAHSATYKCQICNQEFRVKPHTCETCGKSFVQRAALLKHQRLHSEETPFSCEICGEKFSNKFVILVIVTLFILLSLNQVV
ncbi:hypothetical protein KUTeg_018931 [Tegillarca granosa]|uniref:C2H2-type domain-containing protein n=1 Tax=Tegillarca granosa TaxID=220873 RepID=A0ABQ9EGH9_TEGGR|nr:hypothetical protein KUTeg_018931 [Tegillarca granosa]